MNTLQFVKWVNLFCVSVSVYNVHTWRTRFGFHYKYYWGEWVLADLCFVRVKLSKRCWANSDFRLIWPRNLCDAMHESQLKPIIVLIGEIRWSQIDGARANQPRKFLIWYLSILIGFQNPNDANLIRSRRKKIEILLATRMVEKEWKKSRAKNTRIWCFILESTMHRLLLP